MATKTYSQLDKVRMYIIGV